jgi:hypothetical protein
MGEHVPKTAGRADEADFWDRTDLERLAPGELEPAEVERPQRPLSSTFAIRLDPGTVSQIRRVARHEEVGVTQLVRRWVLDRLRIEESVGSLATPTSGFYSDLELGIRRSVITALLDQLPKIAEDVVQDALDRVVQEGEDIRESLVDG